jgi:hypothetical protein
MIREAAFLRLRNKGKVKGKVIPLQAYGVQRVLGG